MHFGESAARRVEFIAENQLLVESPPAAAVGRVPLSVTLDGVTRTAGERFDYVEDRPEIDLTSSSRWTFRVGDETALKIGRGLEFADFDDDGVDDLLIASYSARDWLVTVVHGSRALGGTMDATTPTPGKTIIWKRDRAPLERVELRARNVGDVNGDGITDIGVAALGDASYLLFGRRSDLPEELDFEEEVTAGRAVRLIHDYDHAANFAPLGDVTGDGVDDFVLTIAWKSLAYFEGRRDWPVELDVEDPESYFAGFLVEDPSFGAFVAQVGDTNGDGRPDVLVNGNTQSEVTPVYLIYGADPDDLPKGEGIVDYLFSGGGVIFEWSERPAVNALISMQVAGAGDVNGDGLTDFLIGDQQGGVSFEGITYLVHGRRDFPPQVVFPARLDPIDTEGVVRFVGQRQSGVALGPAGDYNDDGRPDFTVGSWDLEQFPPGKIDLVFGGPDLPAELTLGDLRRHGFRLEGIHTGAFLVETAHVAGDLNGDGAGDFAFSEWRIPSLAPEDDPDPTTGSVHVVFGIPRSVEFIRGDADSDGTLNLTDAVFALSFLFLGGTVPICEDAADVDDFGSVELTDAVYLLNHLFLGGAAPPAPYPEAGQDPTEDALGCRGF